MNRARVHLVDGTYELFRAYFGAPESRAPDGREVGATKGLMRSLLRLLGEPEVTHVAVAFDSVIESFRNELYAGYKTGEGIDPDLERQFPLAERATVALGMVSWGMVEFEADDALASAAHRFRGDERVRQVVICSPDKDLSQCVVADEVVCRDRLREKTLDEAGVIAKFGVPPASIPDWLALVGDSADGFPGIARWGAKSAATVLSHYGHVDRIPDDAASWQVKVRGATALAEALARARDEVHVYRELATLRLDVALREDLDALAWRGARRQDLEALCEEIGMGARFLEQIPAWRPHE